MVKFLKPNKAVIVLQGRYAGRKAVIVRAFDEGTRDRPYGHCLVAGVSKYPKKVIRKDSAKKTAKKSRVKAFVKLINFQHVMPTRYTLDVDLKDVLGNPTDLFQSRDKKVTAAKEVKARFEERFKTGKNSCSRSSLTVLWRRWRSRQASDISFTRKFPQNFVLQQFKSAKEVNRKLDSIFRLFGRGFSNIPEDSNGKLCKNLMQHVNQYFSDANIWIISG